jgi:hypothetical protein
MSEQYWKDRADALERENARFREAEGVLDEIRFALEEHGYVHMANGDGIRSLIQDAALAQQEPDQPAQDGGRLDPYTLAYVEKMVRGQQYKDGPFRQWPEFWPGNRNDTSLVTQFADLAADAIRNLQPDHPAQDGVSNAMTGLGRPARPASESGFLQPSQPADAGEPSTDQERFERVWQQLAYSLADFFALEVTDAQARSIAREVLQAADAGEADEWECSMCGETMAREATWGDCGHEHCPMLPSEMEADAAIRRTGDTGGGDE